MRERFVTGKRTGFAGIVVEYPLDEKAGRGGDPQAIERPRVRVSLPRSTVACDNAGTVRSVAVTVGAIGYVVSIPFEVLDPPLQVQVHGVGVSAVEARIRHTNCYTRAAKTELLGHRRRSSQPIIAAYQLGGRLIHQFAPGRAFNPKDGTGLRQRIQAGEWQNGP